MINATIIADSLNEHGQRLTTFVLVFPRIVLAEFNTHRMLSRNSASSRAIPFEKMLKMVKENPFIPLKWMKDHKGMQGTEYFNDYDRADLDASWLTAKHYAIKEAERLSNFGATKQVCNRLLEPFLYHTCICTATEWENFFALRADDAAEIHIQDLAEKMLIAYNESTPKLLRAGQWHIPFGSKMDVDRILPIFERLGEKPGDRETDMMRVRIATARCARVSYLNFEGKDDYEADIRLHDTLIKSGHFSPTEHCAKAMSKEDMESWMHTTGLNDKKSIIKAKTGWCGNFRGFIQYRKMIEGENKTDKRVKKHEKTI